MKKMYKVLFIIWLICAGMSLVDFIFVSHDYDKFYISMLQGLLAWKNWDDYKGDA